ncbi:MAG: S1 RNA-binding domain-containing protein [Patescibacteria group bacterium]
MSDATQNKEDLKELLKDKTFLQVPRTGDLVKGAVISITKNEVKIDLPGYRTGVVRGNELYNESEEFAGLKPGEEIEATVVDLENENGDVELSFRFAGQQKTWTTLDNYRKSGERVKVKVIEANKGGLMVKLLGIAGFIPVSQLSPDNYPRVQGGDKSKILERLRKIIGKEIDVKVLDVSKDEGKLILSEKQIWEEEQKENIAKYKVGDIVEGEITAVTDFGIFLKFNDLEGLIHISELAWQRIENPQSLYKIGDKIKAVMVNIQGSRIFLSTKRLQEDPWKDVESKYAVGTKVKGRVLKVNPFGLFVELDKDIHGLAHVSELNGKNPSEVTVGDELEFTIISIEPKEHRLGLSLGEPKKEKKEKKEEKAEVAESEEK